MSWDILSKANLQYLLTRLKVVTDSITRGHAIKNSSGSSMTQRNGLEFSDAHVSDDSTNDKTIVDVIKETSNISNETEEGFYFDTSKPEAVINAEQVAFDKSGTSFTSDDVDGVLREVDSAIPNVVNNLTSTSTTDALSAYQGKVLNDKVETVDSWATSVSAGGGNYPIIVKKNGKTVNLWFWCDKAIADSTVIATLPAAYRPFAPNNYPNVHLFGDAYSAPNLYLQINPANGEIKTGGANTNTWKMWSCTWLTS